MIMFYAIKNCYMVIDRRIGVTFKNKNTKVTEDLLG